MKELDNFLVEDLILSNEKFLGKEKFFMLSESRQKYIKLTKAQYNFYSRVVPWLKAVTNEEEVNTQINDLTGGKLQLQQLKDVFEKYNLLFNTVEEVKGKVEVDLSSMKLKEISLSGIQNKFTKVFKYVWALMRTILYLMILWIAGLFIFRFSYIEESLQVEPFRFDSNLMQYNIIIIAGGTILALLGHEIGHLLSANHNKIQWKSVNILLKWGVRLSCYIRYKNFYMYTSLVKIRVLLAGVYMNLFQACLWFLLFIYIRDFKFLVLTTMNLLCIVNNVLPHGTSDGYHIFCILIGIEGIRWKMIKVISTIIKSPRQLVVVLRKKENILLFMYFILSYAISLFACYTLLKNLLDYLNILENNTVIITGTVIFILLIVSIVGYNIRKFLVSVKEI